jgi:hypothetical protein
LKVEDQIFWVSRQELAGYSLVFETMLYGRFKEAKQDEIELKGKKAVDILELIQCLIPNLDQKPIDFSNVESMLQFSDEYQIENLRSRSEVFIGYQLKSLDRGDQKLFICLRLGSKYRLHSILQQCVKRCALEFQLEEPEPIFEDLRRKVISALMIYRSKISPNSNCRYRINYDTVCSQHNNAYNKLICIYCGFSECAACLNNDNRNMIQHCQPNLSQIDNTVRNLLNSMK